MTSGTTHCPGLSPSTATARSARLPTAPHRPSSPALKADGLRQHVRSVLQVREAPGQRRDSQVLGSASENFRPASVYSSASGSTRCPSQGTNRRPRSRSGPRPRTGRPAREPAHVREVRQPGRSRRNRRGRDDYRLQWVCGSRMPNLPSPGSGEAPGQRFWHGTTPQPAPSFSFSVMMAIWLGGRPRCTSTKSY